MFAVLQALMLPLMAVAFYMTFKYLKEMFVKPSVENLLDLIFSICTFILCLVVTGLIQINETGIL